MPEYITAYFRDGTPIPYEQWNELLNEDITQESRRSVWDVSHAVSTDISKGRDVWVNGHDYSTKTDLLFNSAADLFRYLMFEGNYDDVLDILKQMPEEEIFKIISKLPYVNVQDKQLLLKDEKDWY